MYLVQLLLPIQNAQGGVYPRALYDDLVHRLTEQFGGMTAYLRSPALGTWEAASGETVRDQVVVYEVMVEELDILWWAHLRAKLETQFGQQELLVRAHEIWRL